MATKHHHTAHIVEAHGFATVSTSRALREYLEASSLLGLDRAPTYDEYNELARVWNYANARKLGRAFPGGFRDLRKRAVESTNLSYGKQSQWAKDSLVAAANRIASEDGLVGPFTEPMIVAYSSRGRIGSIRTIRKHCSNPDGKNGLANLNLATTFSPSRGPLPRDFGLSQFLDRIYQVYLNGGLLEVPSRDNWNAFARAHALPSVRSLNRNLIKPQYGLSNFSELRVLVAAFFGGTAKHSGRWNKLSIGPKRIGAHRLTIALNAKQQSSLVERLQREVLEQAQLICSQSGETSAETVKKVFSSPYFVSRPFLEIVFRGPASSGLATFLTELRSQQSQMIIWGVYVRRLGLAPNFFSVDETKDLARNGGPKKSELEASFRDATGSNGLHIFRIRVSSLTRQEIPVNHWTYRRIVKAAADFVQQSCSERITLEAYECGVEKFQLPKLERLRDVSLRWDNYFLLFQSDVTREIEVRSYRSDQTTSSSMNHQAKRDIEVTQEGGLLL